MNLSFQLDWIYNVQFAGLLLADHNGLYKKQGLDVDLKPWVDGMDVVDTVVDDMYTIGCAEQAVILAGRARGAPIKAVATMFQKSPMGLMTAPNRVMSQITDLKGAKVGVHIDGLPVMDLVKDVNNLPRDYFEVVEIDHGNKFDRVLSGELDAVQCYAVDETVGIKSKYGVDPTILGLGNCGFKSYAQVVFAHERLIKEEPEVLRQLLEATFLGWVQCGEDTDAAARIVVDHYAETNGRYSDLPYQQGSLKLVTEYLTLGIKSAEIGVITPEKWEDATSQFVKYGILVGDQLPENALDASLWKGIAN